MAFCTSCGAKVEDGVRFCTECGAPIAAAPQAGQQEQPHEQMTQAGQMQQSAQVQQPTQQQAQSGQMQQQMQQGGGFAPSNGMSPNGMAPNDMSPYGPNYAQAGRGAQSAPQKKNMLPFIIIGAVAVIGIIIAAVLVVSKIFSGSGKVDANDPNLGKWKAVSAEQNGQAVDVKESFGGDLIFDLQKSGKVAITMGDQDATAKWTLDGEKFTVKGAGLNSTGTLKNGVLTVNNFLDSGINATFEKVGGYKGAAGGTSTSGGTTAVPGASSGSSTDQTGNASGATYYILDVEATAGMKEMVEAAGEEAANMGYELLPDGTCYYYMATVKMAGEIKDGAFIPKNQRDGFSTDGKVAVDGDTLTMEENGFTMYFKKVDEKPAFMNEAMDLDALMESNGMPDGAGTEKEFVSPTTQITYPSKWYGYVKLFNFKGLDRDEMIEDAWGYFGIDPSGKAYLEIYDTPDEEFQAESCIFSIGVEEAKYGILPIIGNEDSWLLDMYLLPEEEDQFYADLNNGALTFTGEYIGEKWSCTVTFYLREQGAPWDEDNEMLPPYYDENH